MLTRVISLVVLAGALTCSPGCSGEGPSTPLPNVIVLVLDTTRADRISAYGHVRETTPNLDAFAASADRYASCTATAPWTLPSHASLFTGLFPFEHGTHGFRVDGMVDNAHPLHPDHRTLAEELGAFGYETAAFVANSVYLAPRHGLDQGFDTYDVKHEPSPGVFQRTVEFLDERAEDAQRSDRPLFLFVNLMDAHRPYFIGAEDAPEEGLLEELCVRVMNEGKPPGELGQRVERRYEAALRSMDRSIGAFFHDLRHRGLFEDSVVVVTSDHGEAFGTHGVVEHAKDVFEPLVSVPLVVKAPQQRDGRVIDENASLVDVPGLVARELPGHVGKALAGTYPRVPGSHPVTAEVHFARPRDLVLYDATFQHERIAIRAGNDKLIVGGDGPELYDLRVDPGELRDLSTLEPERVQTMKAALDAFLAAAPYRGEQLAPRPFSPAVRAQMEALGYSASGIDSSSDDGPR